MEVLHTIFFAIIALGVLVSFHEFGHFWVARKCGVKVLRFSIGFGRPIFRWCDRQGTEFTIAWLPLGGYVRMVDEREGNVAPEDLPFAFNRKSVWQRMAVVVAGPLANFLLAAVAYWVVFVYGSLGVSPLIGGVVPDSVADRAGFEAGQQIVAVDGRTISTYEELSDRLVRRIGDNGTMQFLVTYPGSSVEYELTAQLDGWEVGAREPDPIADLGLLPHYRNVVFADVVEGKAADRAGLLKGDKVLLTDGEPIKGVQNWIDYIQAHAGQDVELLVARGEEQVAVVLQPELMTLEDGSKVGMLGVMVGSEPWPEDFIQRIQVGPVEAIGKALRKTWDMSVTTLLMVKKMVTGDISAEHLSGPFTIAKVAGASAESGLPYFLKFIAMLSVSLGVLNLLPIPVLDGGHLMYYIAEAIKGSPVSEKIQMLGYRVGLFMVMGLMGFALYNDLLRF